MSVLHPPHAPRAQVRFTSHARMLGALVALFATCGAAQAQSTLDTDAIREQIAALRAEQARIAEMQARTEASIRTLEASLGIAAPPRDTAALATTTPPAPATVAATAPAAAPASRLKVAGDLRVRGQGDFSDDAAPDRRSGSVRGRLGATYEVSDLVSVGARLVTGDDDDPNSTDVAISNFDDKFKVSLDLAYTRLNFGNLQVYGGKTPLPFTRTELVWDGDVNPQGVSATYKLPLAGGSAFRANGLFFLVDEQAAGPESTMLGAQVGYDTAKLGDWAFDASLAYYHYTLDSLAGADAGDFRTNLRKPDGSYLSDFHLGDLIVGATWTGLGENWPLRVVADYVHNFGAATSADTGYGIDLLVGRTRHVGDWRFGYGFAVAQTDAVLAAFSHDNTAIATNYRQHMLSADVMVTDGTTINASWAHYKPYSAVDAGNRSPGDWLDRFRLALLVTF
ncbi:putative porin [Dokdonella sp. MW10]|uniref:putative porin n=1 Tax=Dokdonella sp. MW10 TaxID=2992926 RepID=UPI003F80FC1E